MLKENKERRQSLRFQSAYRVMHASAHSPSTLPLKYNSSEKKTVGNKLRCRATPN